jgi:Ser/Thr protein kinase RdoA (MazF antagonist)
MEQGGAPTVPPSPSFVVMSDLCFDGFTDSRPPPSDVGAARGALRWLARLHGTFMTDAATTDDADRARVVRSLGGLWPQAQYFHLRTRSEELARLPESCTLRRQAAAWDGKLRAAPQTICHGDAKLPNFLFRPEAPAPIAGAGPGADSRCREAAGVDFQYSGLGCGMSDVAYLLHSTVGKAYPAAHRGDAYPPAGFCRPGDVAAEEAEYIGWRAKVDPLLEGYFMDLAVALSRSSTDGAGERAVDGNAIIAAYREVFEAAYLDYWRFYMGWFAPLRPPTSAATDDDVMDVAPGFVRHMLARQVAP